jgi:LmbE family N-acetylglucosaminyl deacetylase
MLRFKLPFSRNNSLRILCLGAHSDDIEIGCGGALLRLLEEHIGCHVDWTVFSANPARRREAVKSAHLFLKNAKTKKIAIRSYKDGFFPYHGAKIKKEFERMKQAPSPDIIFTHCRNDLHQDHRLLNELTWNTFRNHTILEYEIPKYDGDLGSPNFFVELSEPCCRRKISYLFQAFRSQSSKQWFTEQTFLSIMRLRGIEANSATQYAEAFYSRKAIL